MGSQHIRPARAKRIAVEDRPPRPGKHQFIGRCLNRVGIPVFVRFDVSDLVLAEMRDKGHQHCVRCRHCGRTYQSIRQIRRRG